MHITNLYDLMDTADSPEIHLYLQQRHRVPFIDHNPRRGGGKKEMDTGITKVTPLKELLTFIKEKPQTFCKRL